MDNCYFLSLFSIKLFNQIRKAFFNEIFLLVFVFTFVQISFVSAQNCSEGDVKAGEKYGYDAEKAYQFGLDIQDRIRNEDLDGLMLMVDDSYQGPRKGYVKNTSFSELFSDEWVSRALKNKPGCKPFRGRFYVGGISYQSPWNIKDPYKISSITGYTQEIFEVFPKGWVFKNNILSPQCFPRKWMSDDNFEAIADHFSIKDNTFYTQPGLFYGKPIDKFSPVPATWNKSQTVKIAEDVMNCMKSNDDISVNEKGAVTTKSEDGLILTYQVLADIPVDHAKVLSINLQRECMLSHLLKIGSDGGGSMGYSWSYWIYGLFKFGAEEYYMLPLREFSSENKAREYVDGIDS